MFDPPFYDIIFFLIPLFSQLFLLDPPVSTSRPPPPRELKNDNSLMPFSYETKQPVLKNVVSILRVLTVFHTVLVKLFSTYESYLQYHGNMQCP